MFSLLSAKALKNQGPSVKANTPLVSGIGRPHTRRPWAGHPRAGLPCTQPIDVPHGGRTRLQPPKDFVECDPPTGRVHRLVFLPSSPPSGRDRATPGPGSSSPPQGPWLCLSIDDTSFFMTGVSQRPSRPSQTLDPEWAQEGPWTISRLRRACGPPLQSESPHVSPASPFTPTPAPTFPCPSGSVSPTVPSPPRGSLNRAEGVRARPLSYSLAGYVPSTVHSKLFE